MAFNQVINCSDDQVMGKEVILSCNFFNEQEVIDLKKLTLA